MTRSVVVVSLRAGDWLAPCLASVRDQADQVVVVDNGSEGAEVSAVGRHYGAVVVRSPANLGFARGANRGLAEASGDVVGVLNDDAVAGASWMATAEGVLADPGVAVVGPKVLLDGWFAEVPPAEEAWFAEGDARPLGRQLFSVRRDGEEMLDRLVGAGIHGLEHGADRGPGGRWRWTRPPAPYYVPVPGADWDGTVVVNDGERVATSARCRLVNSAGMFLRRDAYAGDHGLEAPDDGRFCRRHECFGVSGAAMVIRADVLGRVGGFAEPFFAYYEDADWCWRVRRAGLAVVSDRSACVVHRRSVTSAATLGARVRILGERNRLLCLARNAPPGVVRAEVGRRLRDGPDHGIRRGMVTRLPWALASRGGLGRRSSTGTAEVWRRWAGQDTGWDDGPCRTGTGAT